MYINERKKRGKKVYSPSPPKLLSQGGAQKTHSLRGGGEREGKEVRILSIIYISTPPGWGGVVEKGGRGG